MKALFPSKKEKKKKYNKKTNHVIHKHSDGRTVMFRRPPPSHSMSDTATPAQTPQQLPCFCFQKGVENI